MVKNHLFFFFMSDSQRKLRTEILAEITDAADDINEYLASDVPLECHADDIDEKMHLLAKRINTLFNICEEK